MTDLQKQIANAPSQPPPSTPKYQGGPGAGAGQWILALLSVIHSDIPKKDHTHETPALCYLGQLLVGITLHISCSVKY